jgi:hypothetical protein
VSCQNLVASAEKTGPDDCKVVTEALKAAGDLKPGMLRADVEKNFTLDGGVSFPGSGTYLFKACHYIKIDVQFDAQDADKNTHGLSKTDSITTISKPYLDYPRAD